MELAFIINTHTDQTECIRDTIDSISTYATNNILVVVDGLAWNNYKDLQIPAYKMEGFRHGCRKSPYKNVALGIKTASENWPDSDWYCYCEYDVLFASDRFKYNLKKAEEMNVWMLGNDGHVDDKELSLISSMIKEKINNSYYLLGCCLFFHRKFINKLKEINFFERFLNITSGFSDGYFPQYNGYDVSEHMYPSLCRHFGGNIGVFATWDQGKWHGASEYFPMRWRPEIDQSVDNCENASIIHPLKSFDNPIREYHRKKREQWKILQMKEK